ncbi:hypothetical protein CDD81_6795 [Ophiocordyceps australis]|uniref:Uncharacterized protein n=1 Tax=Ophiocordyceps australis TaxID=1399860 RepID=A0A2C5X996_9HYPO|nr:hypothetical protein CDD81_6795 [Ophiocordyceps australis]
MPKRLVHVLVTSQMPAGMPFQLLSKSSLLDINRRLLSASARHVVRPNIYQKRQFPQAPIHTGAETVLSASARLDETTINPLKSDLVRALKKREPIKAIVLRSILSAYWDANAQGKQKTILDFALLVRKIQRQMIDAADQAKDAGREDVYVREAAQLELVEEYMRSKNFNFLTDQEILSVAKPKLKDAIDARIDKKTWIKHIVTNLKLGKTFAGKFVDQSDVRRVVSKMCREQDMKDAEDKKQADS